VAAGESLPLTQEKIVHRGHAIEARLYAEDPDKGFLPSVGILERLRLPSGIDGIRVDAGVREGDPVTMFYDPMIAKVIGWSETREDAAGRLASALAETQVAGVRTNAAFLVRALREKDFLKGDIDTGFIERHRASLLPEHVGVPPQILARAAQFLVDERSHVAKGFDPWNAQDGFRLAGEARETIEFVASGARARVEIVHRRGGAISIVVDGTDVEPTSHAAAMRLASGDIAVMEGGETFVLSLYDPFAAADAADNAADSLTAPMPGKIVRVYVKAGENVARGSPLVVLEAMKMEHTLAAPADARVEAVDVAQGDQVGEGAVVLRFAKPERSKAAE
jgi:3-methylcrotonyl-CoA carboxylase alpha subunit